MQNTQIMKKIPATLLILLILIVLYGCSKPEATGKEEKTINVQVAVVKTVFLKPFIETTGTLEPFERITVSSEADGLIKQLYVNEGEKVKKGAPLALIDTKDYSLELSRAQQAYKQAQATLSNTNLEFERKKALYDEELVTKQQFDDVSTRKAIAQAEAERMAAASELARVKFTKTKPVSPITGAIELKKISAGDFVKYGAPMFSIIQTSKLKLYFNINEKNSAIIKPGNDVEFSVDAITTKKFNAKVTMVYPALDDKTRMLKIEAVIDNPDGALKAGYFAKVTLYAARPGDVLTVPSTSLIHEGEKAKVFVVEGTTAKHRQVSIGQSFSLDGTDLTVIYAGLKAGEQVVTVGQQTLFDGAAVKVIDKNHR
ncbi:MAG: efflux RND transporter periplasmic adaptor subunit [Nitrospirae bacterium]|nr:efflux RND transporter periplasmic adaptor subunit [Nitrospirota bacterium]MBF0535032.1 efflux RND transporter periplasmic adaptor subunit [Nitrospirota bacterium]MBF0616540.1 efflux RND transporter periplasmic adaptor subunit [Nitrospirota bacterium]